MVAVALPAPARSPVLLRSGSKTFSRRKGLRAVGEQPLTGPLVFGHFGDEGGGADGGGDGHARTPASSASISKAASSTAAASRSASSDRRASSSLSSQVIRSAVTAAR